MGAKCIGQKKFMVYEGKGLDNPASQEYWDFYTEMDRLYGMENWKVLSGEGTRLTVEITEVE